MKAVKFLLLAASAMCITHPRGHGNAFGHNKPKHFGPPGNAFGLNKPKHFGPPGKGRGPHFPKKWEKEEKEEIKQQLNDLIEPKYEFLLEMNDKMQNEGLTEDELRGVIKAVPELQYVEEYVDDIMQNQQNGKVSLNNLQEKINEFTE